MTTRKHNPHLSKQIQGALSDRHLLSIPMTVLDNFEKGTPVRIKRNGAEAVVECKTSWGWYRLEGFPPDSLFPQEELERRPL